MSVDLITKNLATSLILYEKIDTTAARAKHIRAYLEHLLAIARRGDLTSRRRLIKAFTHRNATKKVFDLIVPNLQNYHRSGFIFSHRIANRMRDNAAMIRLVIDPRLTELPLVEKKSKQTTKSDVKTIKTKESASAKRRLVRQNVVSTNQRIDQK